MIDVQNPDMSSVNVSRRHSPNLLPLIEEEEKVPHDNESRSARMLREIKK